MRYSRWQQRQWAAAFARARLMLVCACVVVFASSGSAHSSSEPVTISMSVGSHISLTNLCTQAAGHELGSVLPGGTAITATGAEVCRFEFQSNNDTASLSIGQADRAGSAMAQGPTAQVAQVDVGALGVFQVTYGTSPTVVYGCSNWGSGEFYKSTDGGATWTMLGMSGSRCDYGLVAATDTLVYGFSAGATVRRTTDGGVTLPWTALSVPGLAGNLVGTAERGTTKLWAAQDSGSGAIRYTADATAGSPVWVNQSTPNITDYNGFASARSGAAGVVWAVGSNAGYSAAVTSNNGTNWTATGAVPPEGDRISSWDASRAWVWADAYRPRVGRTTDGGASWQTSDLPWDTGGLAAVVPVSATDVWAFGRGALVARSADGGATWTRIDHPSTEYFGGGGAFDVNRAAVGGLGASILSTTDGGATWDNYVEEPGLRAVTAANGQRAWAAGSEGTLVRTNNGGTTWSPQASGVTAGLHGISAADSQNVWAVGSGGTIIHTDDGGSTWTPQASGVPSEQLQDVSAVSGSIAWAVGSGGTIRKTTNGGTVWTGQASGTTEPLHSIEALSDQDAWVAGENGVVLITSDGGATWNPPAAPIPDAPDLWDLALLDSNTAVVTTHNWNEMWVTEDGGSSWVNRGSQTIPKVNAVAGTGTLFATRGDNQLIRSTDNGVTWTNLTTSGQYSNHYDLEAVDANTAWAVGSAGNVRKVSETQVVPDHASGSQDWTTPVGGGMFGVCVQDLGLSAIVDGPWIEDTVNTPGTCQASNLDPWRAIPSTPSKVAHTNSAGQTGRVDLVWGARVPSAQEPGAYTASVTIEAAAPNV